MGVSESKEVKSVELCSGSDVLEGERREQSSVWRTRVPGSDDSHVIHPRKREVGLEQTGGFMTVIVRCNSHTARSFKVISVIVTEFCNRLPPEHFHHSEKNPCTH